MNDGTKIFVIGFNKCATLSLHKLFNEYSEPNLTSIHWNKGYLGRDIHRNISVGRPPLQGYESFVVFSDMECFISIEDQLKWIFVGSQFFDLLDLHYPGSKFILNTRNMDSWINSRLRHQCDYAPMKHGYTKRSEEFIHYSYLHKTAYKVDSDEQIIQIWKDQWIEHHDNVLTHFITRPNDLLVYNIDQDPFAKVSDFFAKCGIFFSTDSLPHANKTLIA